MKIKDRLRRRRLKKISGHRWFHYDDIGKNDFFYNFTNDHDVSILVYSLNTKTYREFILDEVVIRAMFEASEGKELTQDKRFLNSKLAMHTVSREYIDNGFTLIKKTGRSQLLNVNVLAKIGDFKSPANTTQKALILRRVVFNSSLIIGMDTLALPIPAVDDFIKAMQGVFKKENNLTQRSTENANN